MKFQHFPLKCLGQHFLINESIARRIVGCLFPVPQDKILEIGPGPGALTKLLLEAGPKRLVLVEKDRYWAQEWTENTSQEVEVWGQDALRFDWNALNLSETWKIIGNLPYNVASPMLWNIVSRCKTVSRAVFMVQKEVGQRITAQPGTRHFGALSVWMQNFVNPKLEFYVAPGSFYPPPKVDSAVLSFVWSRTSGQAKSAESLNRLLKLCFQQRRKQIGGIFKRAGKTRLLQILDELRLSPQSRPEELTVRNFQMISDLWIHER